MVNTAKQVARGQLAALDHQGILAEVRRRGSSLRRLSVEAGYAPSTVNASLYKFNRRPHAVLAKFIDRRLHELWPHWYGPDDQPLPFEQRRAAEKLRRAA